MTIFIWLWIGGAFGTIIYPDTIVTRYPEQYPSWIISAFGTPSQRIWLPYEEGAPFQGTNGDCQQRCYEAACPGWSWVPPQKELALEYGDDALQSIVGTCRLYFPSNTYFYLYTHGQKWSHDLQIGDGGTCPRNTTEHVGFVGKNSRGKMSYKQTVFPNFFIGGKQFVLINETELGTGHFWCSNLYNACGATWTLYEKAGLTYEYATTQIDEEWEFKCYVWPTTLC